MSAGPHIAVVGAGVLGTSIAYHLVQGGARVSLIEAAHPGAGATGGSLAWINAHAPVDEGYFRLRVRSIHLWQALARDLPDLPVRFCGGLEWEGSAEEMHSTAARNTSLGYPSRVIDEAEIAALEPHIAAPPQALLTEMDALADPDRIAGGLIDAAALQVQQAEVTGLRQHAGRVIGVETTAGTVEADHIVIAAGLGSLDLVAPLGIALPMNGDPGLLIRTQAKDPLTRRLIAAPGAHFWQMADGRVLVGASYAGAEKVKDIDTAAEAICTRLDELFPDAGRFQPESHTYRARPIAADDRPILGALPGVKGLSLAITHSGVTLAPVIGAGLASEVLTGTPEPDFAPYRAQRFL
ncbi:MAG: FAD-dependent oxidoreductase [Pseudomonadota bacterium]